jgi:acyl dehydratase
MSAHPSYAELWGVAVGEELPAITQAITQEFIDRYAAASLDFNPVHIDPDWSARAKVFGRPATVLHGMAQMSLLCSLVLRAWGAATEITRIEGKFTKPVFVGETVKLTGVVTEVHPLGEGRDHLVVATTASDSSGDVVGVTSLSVRKPPVGRPAEPGQAG